jgi:UDP-N-acetylglucosamine 2-epimerase (non-hydrolysing)
VTIEAPLRYGEMLEAISQSQVIVTDSGDLQEEASWYGVPVVVLRNSSPQWESLIARSSVLVGSDPGRALDAARAFSVSAEQLRVNALPCPYGDGHVAARISGILTHPSTQGLLEIGEPDFAALPSPLVLGGDSSSSDLGAP